MKRSPYDPETTGVFPGEGDPEAVTVRGRFVKVRKITNTWRVDDEWWHRPVARIYYRLELESGASVTVFRDLLTSLWYRQNYTGDSDEERVR